MKRISVIIPVYNQLDFFKNCIKSVCNQTYKELEIICIDDGSTDGVGEYLDIIKKNDNRVVVIHQDNAGESNARNKGLEVAKGDYITFVDCDDWIDEDMYERLITEAEINNLDVVACSWYKEHNNKTEMIRNEKDVNKEIINRDDLLRYIYMRDSYRGFAYIWNKLYKRDLIYSNKGILKFDESLKLGGDVLYLAQMAVGSNKSKYVDRSFYHYRIRHNSGSHSMDLERMKDWIRAYELAIDYLKERSVQKETIEYAIRFMAYHAYEGAGMAIKLNNEEKKNYFQQVMVKNYEVYKRLNAEHKERVMQYEKIMDY